ncbi:metallophosphoesterase [Phocaeicola sp.]
MSHGAYLEFANRALDKVNVYVEFTTPKNWEHHKPPANVTYILDKTNFYTSNQLEMSSAPPVTGKFKLTITIDGKQHKIDGNLADAINCSLNRCRYLVPQLDCILIVTYGIHLVSLNGKKMEKGRGCYRFEFYDRAKLRFGVINDLHFGAVNIGDQSSRTDHMALLRYRPEYIVMPGDLLNCPTPPHKNIHWGEAMDVWKFFIDPLEMQNIPVAEGFGNHDLWTGSFNKNVKKHISQRNNDRNQGLGSGYGFRDSKSIGGTNQNYHYYWMTDLYKDERHVKVVSVMLNNLPGSYNREDPVDTDKCHKEGTYAYNAYHYLDWVIKDITACKFDCDVVGLLFFHMNYACDQNNDIEGNPERWWVYAEKKLLSDLLNKSAQTLPFVTAFFGHEHEANIEKQMLNIGSRQDWENVTEHFGYRCAMSKDTPRLNLIDLELVEEGGTYKLHITPSWVKLDDIHGPDCPLVTNKTWESVFELPAAK